MLTNAGVTRQLQRATRDAGQLNFGSWIDVSVSRDAPSAGTERLALSVAGKPMLEVSVSSSPAAPATSPVRVFIGGLGDAYSPALAGASGRRPLAACIEQVSLAGVAVDHAEHSRTTSMACEWCSNDAVCANDEESGRCHANPAAGCDCGETRYTGAKCEKSKLAKNYLEAFQHHRFKRLIDLFGRAINSLPR